VDNVEIFDSIFWNEWQRLNEELRQLPGILLDPRPNEDILRKHLPRDAPGRIPLQRGMRDGQYVFVDEGNPRLRASPRSLAPRQDYGTREEVERPELQPYLRGDPLIDCEVIFSAAFTWSEFVGAEQAKAHISRIAQALGGKLKSFNPERLTRRGIIEIPIELS